MQNNNKLNNSFILMTYKNIKKAFMDMDIPFNCIQGSQNVYIFKLDETYSHLVQQHPKI